MRYCGFGGARGRRWCSAGQTESHECWDCRSKTKVTSFFCQSCKVVQPIVGTQSAYEIFTLPLTFDVSRKLLNRQYLNFQRQLHPDRYMQSKELELKYAESRSAEVNEAYMELKDPIRRGKLLLRLRGHQVKEKDTLADPAFLMETMELREEIDDAQAQSELESLLSTVQSKYDIEIQHISSNFQKQQLDEAKASLYRLTYLQKMLDEIQKKLPSS